jgi:IclR family KDG regulon transcriptional repressor
MATTKRTEPARTRSQSTERAALVLACFSAEEPLLSLAELSARLELSQSTVFRYVAALQSAGLLERDDRGGYRLGLRVVELAGIAVNQIEVRKHALDEMESLRAELHLLVNLGVLFEGDVMHIAASVPEGWPRWYTILGRRAVAHCTTLGKVLLAHRPWDQVQATIERYGWRPYTANSIQNFDQLQIELERIRREGYAIDNEERRIGSICLGVPIRDYSGAIVAALSVSGTTETLSAERRTQVLPRLLAAAGRTSFRMGYSDQFVS